jgi:hypothetical protein
VPLTTISEQTENQLIVNCGGIPMNDIPDRLSENKPPIQQVNYSPEMGVQENVVGAGSPPSATGKSTPTEEVPV